VYHKLLIVGLVPSGVLESVNHRVTLKTLEVLYTSHNCHVQQNYVVKLHNPFTVWDCSKFQLGDIKLQSRCSNRTAESIHTTQRYHLVSIVLYIYYLFMHIHIQHQRQPIRCMAKPSMSPPGILLF